MAVILFPLCMILIVHILIFVFVCVRAYMDENRTPEVDREKHLLCSNKGDRQEKK